RALASVPSLRLRDYPLRPVQRPAAGPHLVERVALVEAAVFHDVADRVRVADVLERVAVEDDHVREFAVLDGADIALKSDRLRAPDGGGAQRVVLGQAAGLH